MICTELPSWSPVSSDVLLSYSQLSSLRKCSEQYRLERSGFPQPPACYLIGGSAFHQATEDYDRHVYEHGKFQVDDDAQAYMVQRWRHHLDTEMLNALAVEPDVTLWRRGGRASKEYPNKEDILWWTVQGEEMCTAYARYMQDSDWTIWTTPEGEPAIELNLSVELGDVTVRGSIDRMMVTPGGELVCRDLKTSSRKPDDDTQLGTYAVMMELTYNVRPSFGDYFLARNGGPSVPLPLGYYTRSMLQSEYETAGRIRSQNLYLASPSGLCNSCGVQRGCAARGGDLAQEWAGIVPDFSSKTKKVDSEEAASE